MRLFEAFFVFATVATAQSTAPLRLEKTIPLPDVRGRIDHMSIDVKNQRFFMAALGNNTVEVIDVKDGKRAHTITGLHEPQGVLYLPDVNRLYVANGEDGSLRIFDGVSYAPIKTVKLGEDADNVRFDAEKKHVYVGYGGASGALAVMNEDGTKVAEIPLDAHPESFQLEKNGPRLFVNLPKSQKVAVVDRTTTSVVTTWGTAEPFRTIRWLSTKKIIVYSLSAEHRLNCVFWIQIVASSSRSYRQLATLMMCFTTNPASGSMLRVARAAFLYTSSGTRTITRKLPKSPP